MKKLLQLVTILSVLCAVARAQVAPAATAGQASLGYSFNYSQSSEFGAGLPDWQTAAASGRIDYRNGYRRLPFSFGYTGGYTWTISGPDYSTGYYQNFVVTQGFLWRKWSVAVADNISLIPQAADTGYLGIPGVGEPSPTPPDESVLTLKTRSVDNFLTTNLNDRFTGKTAFNASAGWGLLRFPDGNGINVNTIVTSAGFTQRLNARNVLIGTYAFSQFSYPDYNLSFYSNTFFVGFTRTWNPRLSMSASGGPQWISGSNSTLVPPSRNLAFNGNMRYHLRNVSAGVSYVRGVSGGAGYLLGANTDIVGVNAAREFGRATTMGIQGTYRRIEGLNHNVVISSEDYGIQVNRRLGRNLTTFAGYTIINQGANAAVPANVLSNVLQSFSFGFGYSRHGLHVSR